jgi:hypothetical protein
VAAAVLLPPLDAVVALSPSLLPHAASSTVATSAAINAAARRGTPIP